MRLGVLRRLVVCGALLGTIVVPLWPASGAAAAELVTHPFLSGRFPVPTDRRTKLPATPPPLPEHSLTGYETEEPEPGNFGDPCGVAVYPASGAILVSDYYHDSIDSFKSEGGWIGNIGGIAPGNGPCGLALSPSGEIYANIWHSGVIRVSDGQVIDDNASTGVAVDPGTGRVYVDDRTYVAVYEPSGEPVMFEGEPLKIGVGSLDKGFGLAVSNFGPTAGDVYVPDAGSETIKVYDPASSLTDPVREFDGAGTPEKRFVQLEDAALAIEQSTGNLYLAEQLVARTESPPAVVYQLDRFGNYRGKLPHELVSGVPTGIAVDESSGGSQGEIYVTTGDERNGGVYAFGPVPPSVAIEVEKVGSGGGTVTSEPDGVDCGATCGAEFKPGTQVRLFAKPDGHSAFVGWMVNGAPSPTCPGVGACAVNLNAETKVTAEFERLPQHLLSVGFDGSGGGTVVSEPEGIECSAPCSEEFGEGKLITLIAHAEPHSTFAGWAVAGEPSACPGTGGCQLQMNGDREVTATFEPIPQIALKVVKVGSGSGEVTSTPAGIACGLTCEGSFDKGSSFVLRASADEGSSFTGWSGGGCSGTGTCQVALAETAEVEADFERNRDRLTVSVSGAGGGRVTSEPAGISCGTACSQQFDQGTLVTLSAEPAPGSVLAGWTGACSGRRLCQVTLSEDAAVGAVFAVARRTLSVVVSGSGHGKVVDPALGISCGLACSGFYHQGTVATLVAEPAAGSTFAGWHRCPRPSGNSCVIAIDGEEEVGAAFTELPSLELGPPLIRGDVALVEADVSSAGALLVRGKGVQPFKLSVSGESPVTLHVRLTRKSKHRLASRGKLEVRLVVTFKPADGANPVTAKLSLAFHGRKGKR